MMGLLKGLSAALSGRNSHWNATNNTVFAELWRRLEVAPQVEGVVYKHLVVAASNVVEVLLFPRDSSSPLVPVDMRTIDIAGFREIYRLLLTIFYFKAVAADSSARGELVHGLEAVLADRRDVDSALAAATAWEKLPADRKANSPLIETWRHIVDIAGCGDVKSDPIRIQQFSANIHTAYCTAANLARAELNQ